MAEFFGAAAIHSRRLGVIKTPSVHVKHVAAIMLRLGAAITSTAKKQKTTKQNKKEKLGKTPEIPCESNQAEFALTPVLSLKHNNC